VSDANGSRLRDPRVALAVLGLGLLATAGLLGLFESTETRYAEIAREMLASGDWLTPRLNGILHLHKPPLAYWAAASGMALFGAGSWGARLPVAFASIVSLACVGTIAGRRFAAWGAPPARAIWVLGSMVLFAALGRSLASDPFLTAAVLLFWALAPSPWALGALGLGFLAKGPVVFLHTALPVLVAAAWGRDRRTLSLLGPARGWWLFAAVALPWFLILAARIPGLLPYLLVNQLWGRYTSGVHQRGGPPWYFVAVAIAGVVPWTGALLAGLARAWRERSSPEARLLLAWFVAPLVFLSFSGSKLPAYLLPSAAASALLAARELDGRLARWSAALMLIALAAVGWLAGPPALGRLVYAGGVGARSVPLPWPAGVALAFSLLAAVSLWRARPELAAALTTAAFVSLGAAAARYDSVLGSPHEVTRLLSGMRAPNEPVFEVGHFNAGLPFYLGERVGLIEVPRETQFDEHIRSHSLELPRDSVASQTLRHGRAWLFGRQDLSEEIARQQGLSYVRIARWRQEALGFAVRR
jgi:4-amino-4-deoxy-L-arabinose transferase-like glycosyltransferase